PSYVLTPPAIGAPSGPARSMTPLPGSRAESGAMRRLVPRRRVRVRDPHLRWFPGCFTRPTGDLDSQLSRRTDHVETWSPPYVFHIVASTCGESELDHARGRGTRGTRPPTKKRRVENAAIVRSGYEAFGVATPGRDAKT